MFHLGGEAEKIYEQILRKPKCNVRKQRKVAVTVKYDPATFSLSSVQSLRNTTARPWNSSYPHQPYAIGARCHFGSIAHTKEAKVTWQIPIDYYHLTKTSEYYHRVLAMKTINFGCSEKFTWTVTMPHVSTCKKKPNLSQWCHQNLFSPKKKEEYSSRCDVFHLYHVTHLNPSALVNVTF